MLNKWFFWLSRSTFLVFPIFIMMEALYLTDPAKSPYLQTGVLLTGIVMVLLQTGVAINWALQKWHRKSLAAGGLAAAWVLATLLISTAK